MNDTFKERMKQCMIKHRTHIANYAMCAHAITCVVPAEQRLECLEHLKRLFLEELKKEEGA